MVLLISKSGRHPAINKQEVKPYSAIKSDVNDRPVSLVKSECSRNFGYLLLPYEKVKAVYLIWLYKTTKENLDCSYSRHDVPWNFSLENIAAIDKRHYFNFL